MTHFHYLLILFALSGCSLNHQKETQVFVSPYKDSIIDNSLGIKFYLDTSMILVSAFDKQGRLLWKTDPWKDNNLVGYSVKRPKIVFFN